MVKKLIIALCVILTLSIVLNIFLIIKGGIIINNKYDQRQDQRQFQFQGQLLMNFFMAQGDTVEWVLVSTNSLEKVKNIISELPPQESFFCHVIREINEGSSYKILYPHFVKAKK